MCWFSLGALVVLSLCASTAIGEADRNGAAQQPANSGAPQGVSLRDWAGLQVEAIEFKGISAERLAPLPDQLKLQPHQPLDTIKVRDSLRRLYETGLYKTIVLEGVRHGNAVTIIFTGVPNLFIGRITVNGVNNERLSGVLERST